MIKTETVKAGERTLQDLAHQLEREDDVKRVIELKPINDDRFRYLIETPFETFPRFVIGTTDASFNDVRIEIRCGAEWNARRHWSCRHCGGSGRALLQELGIGKLGPCPRCSGSVEP